VIVRRAPFVSRSVVCLLGLAVNLRDLPKISPGTPVVVILSLLLAGLSRRPRCRSGRLRVDMTEGLFPKLSFRKVLAKFVDLLWQSRRARINTSVILPLSFYSRQSR